MKFIIPLYPPFHAMKHGLESIEGRSIFQMLIKAPLAKRMGFKAANNTLQDKFFTIAKAFYESSSDHTFVECLPQAW